MKNKIIPATLVIIGFALGATTLSALADWTAPVGTPPNCTPGSPGCDAPINVGPSAQTKLGSLTVNAGSVIDDIGLTIAGRIKLDDVHKGLGKILTSDSNGAGSWQGIMRLFANLKTYAPGNSSIVELIGVLEPGTYTFSGKITTVNSSGGSFDGVFMSDSMVDTYTTADAYLSSIYGGSPVTSASDSSYGPHYYNSVSAPNTIFIVKRNGLNDSTWTVPDTNITITSRKFVYAVSGQSYLTGYVYAR